MTPGGDRDGDLLDELMRELAEGVLEDEETLREEVEAAGGVSAVKEAVGRAKRTAAIAIGEARRALLRSKPRTQVVQRTGEYASLSDEEVSDLWVARTQGLDASNAAVQFRDFEDVTADDMRSLLEDLDRLEARREADEDG